MKPLSDLTGPGDIREKGIAVLLDKIERIVEFLEKHYTGGTLNAPVLRAR